MLAACDEAGVPVDVPVERLSAAQREWILRGDGKSWHGVRGFFARLERKRYKVQARVLIARYRRFDPCGDCGGARLAQIRRAGSDRVGRKLAAVGGGAGEGAGRGG